jgi:excisionase family DNA binding protein
VVGVTGQQDLLERVAAENARPIRELALVVDGQRYELEGELGQLVVEMIRLVSRSAGLIDMQAMPLEITTGQAADLLGVSRPTVVQLIESGKLPATRVGSRRRLRTVDVLRHRDSRTSKVNRRALEELTAYSEELGLYDD